MKQCISKTKLIIDLTQAYVINVERGLKHQEIALQKVIENTFNTTWWKVCTLNIFEEILNNNGKDPVFLSDKILKNIEKNISGN